LYNNENELEQNSQQSGVTVILKQFKNEETIYVKMTNTLYQILIIMKSLTVESNVYLKIWHNEQIQ